MANSSQWFNPPKQYSDVPLLRFTTAAHTDFWQHTHYHFYRDNGHFYYWQSTAEQLSLLVEVQVNANSKFDQAGIMLRKDAHNWLKISAEWLSKDQAALGSVNTQNGKSDWASQSIKPATNWTLKVEISQQDAVIFALLGEEWQQLRVLDISHIRDKDEICIGIYGCSPDGPGCEVRVQRVEFHESVL
jgi:regulation of enolase protein 1 (concanavalin A-like superfamily)